MPRLAILTAALTMTATAFAQTPDTIFLEELTWTEVRDAVAAGTTTIIIPMILIVIKILNLLQL